MIHKSQYVTIMYALERWIERYADLRGVTVPQIAEHATRRQQEFDSWFQ